MKMNRPYFLLALALCLVSINMAHSQTIWISELMADNDNTLPDEDGDSPDWIELHNTSDSPVDLDGWYLTDDVADLTQWSFPPTTIPAKGFLVIFASDKDRTVAGAELHTNFKLSASGEQVVLVHPDGSTVEDELSFSLQQEDVSYGYAFFSGGSASLLDSGARCFARVPAGAADSTDWKNTEFDYSANPGWLGGYTGVGYENGTGYESLINLDVAGMHNVNASVYIRVPFTLTDANQLIGLTLKMKYDDGFVAYINGMPVASANAPASPVWNSPATTDHFDEQAKLFEVFDLAPHLSALQEGDNILAIHGLNALINSSDLLILPELEANFASDIDVGTLGTMAMPTPGVANSAIGYLGNVEPPVATPEHGFYDAPFLVTLSNVTAGATIRYTMNSSEPTESSTPYTEPLTISTTVNLRFRAFFNGWKPSVPHTETYIFLDDVVAETKSGGNINRQFIEFGMGSEVCNATYHDAANQPFNVQDALKAIPSISIATARPNLFDPATGIYVHAYDRWERPASVELIHPDGTKGFHINAGLRLRGGFSRSPDNPKHSFRLLFKDEYGEGKLKYPLFEDEGTESFDKIDLRTAQNFSWAWFKDPNNALLRDVLVRDSAAAMDVPYTRSRYYHLYLNGKYWGLFMTEERPVADYAASYMGGDSDDYDVIKTAPYTVETTDGTPDAWLRLHAATMAGFASNADYFSVQGMDANGELDPAKERLLDVDNMIDYLLLIYYGGACDNGISFFMSEEGVNNFYAIYNRVDPDGFKWMQHDSEHYLDVSSDLNRTGPYNHSNFDLPQFLNPQTIHQKLSVNAEYRLRFADHVHKHYENGGALMLTNMVARLDARAAQIDRAIVGNSARWGNPSLNRDTWLGAVFRLRNFMVGRIGTVIGYLDADGLIPSIDAPQFSLPDGLVADGTTVAISAGTTIYYTTDGSDPRAIGGAPVGSAYSIPIAITKPVNIKARARTVGGEWSALAEGVFWTPDIPLAVTELMYHAPDGNQHDFVEIRNVSSETVQLRGYKLDSAVEYKFKNSTHPSLAPGQFLVAIKDIDAFGATYPTNGIAIAGEYKNDFGNGGEKVELEFKNNDLITFSYSDARNWPQAADGAGHSLVPLDSAMDDQERGSLDYGGNWRASTYAGGSPGYADLAQTPTVMLNEITAHTDTGQAPPFDSNDQIELFNPTPSDIILNGWYLSDDLDNPSQWSIPNGTVVPAFGFALFDENNFHPGRTNGFGLNKAGEQIVLSAPGQVIDSIRFKGQENGASWGRYPDGSKDWMTTLPTPGTPNQAIESSVRISALMYHPENGNEALEYIQLENPGAYSIVFETVAGSWRIDGGVSFTFPSGTSLPAGEKLWLVPFDPAVDNALLTLFASTYGLTPAQETILGPYSGQLSNRGERVALERPQESDDPLKPLDVSWVIVDELFYFDQAPWPSGADGTGYPLIRTGLAAWGVPTAADTDADGMPDSWEMDYFGSMEQSNPDWDSDLLSNFEEYIAGTDPTNPASFFIIEDMAAPTIYWTAALGRTYSVHWTDDLQHPFVQIVSGLTAGSYADNLHSNGPSYYRIKVEME